MFALVDTGSTVTLVSSSGWKTLGGGGPNKGKHFKTGQTPHGFFFFLNNNVFKKNKTILNKIKIYKHLLIKLFQ